MNEICKEPKIQFDKLLVAFLSVMWLLVQLYFMLIRPAHPMIQVPIFLSFAVGITFATKPLGRGVLRWLDYACIVLSFYTAYHYVANSARIIMRIPHVSKLAEMDVAVVVMVVLLLMEAVRRVLGLNLYIFVWVFVAYAFFGNYLFGFLKFGGMQLDQFVEIMGMATDGIFGTPIAAVASFIFFFILFGAFFSVCGGGQVLIDIGLKCSGSHSGGPAQAAVVSSGLMGMISGSAVANVSTTGVLTIPMMKRAGYTPEQAAAIEAVASTGGQIMPPIMGVGAFIMAELLGIRYGVIAMSAILPAVAYFGSVLLLVGFIAKRNQAKMPVASAATRFEVAPILPRLYFLIPAAALVYYVLSGSSLRMAAMTATVGVLGIFLLARKITPDFKERLFADLRIVWKALLDGIHQCADIALPTAACGIIIGVVIQSGLANKFSGIIAAVGGSSILPSLLITMAGCMLMGMALPTVAAYLVAVVLFVPELKGLGVPLLVAHMFCFYFGIVAQITPPVCLASFTAAGIAGADSWKTGWTGFRYALVAFLIPFVFVYQPAILLLGTPMEILHAAAVLFLGTFALAAAMGGYLFAPLDKPWERGLLFAVAFMLIAPEVITDIIGAALFAVVMVYSLKQRKKARLQAGLQE